MREEKEKKVSVITHHHHQHVCAAQFSFALWNNVPSPRWIGNILAHQRAASRVELLTLQRPPQSSPARTRARMPIPKFTKFTEMSKVVIYFDDKTGCLFDLKSRDKLPTM